jgi:hypothetical protein
LARRSLGEGGSLAFTFCSRTIIPNHDDFVEECLEAATVATATRRVNSLRKSQRFRDLPVRRLHNQRPALKPGFNGRNNDFYSSSFLGF